MAPRPRADETTTDPAAAVPTAPPGLPIDSAQQEYGFNGLVTGAAAFGVTRLKFKLDAGLKPQKGEAPLTVPQATAALASFLGLQAEYNAVVTKGGIDIDANEAAPRPGVDATRVVAMLTKVAGTLPDNVMYPSVLAQVDIGQLLKPIVDAPRDQHGSAVVNSVAVLDGESTKLLTKAFDTYNAQQGSTIESQAAAMQITDQAQIQEMKQTWADRQDSNLLGVSPATAFLRYQSTTSAENAQGLDLGTDSLTPKTYFDVGATGSAANVPLLSAADVQDLFRSVDPSQAIAGVKAATSAYADYQAGGAASSQMLNPTAVPFRMDAPTPKQTRPYSINEISQLPYTMKPAELTALTANLAKAGYFGVDDNGKIKQPEFPGSPLDDGLQAAWQKVIADSVKAGIPVNQLLKQRAAERQATGKYDPNGNVKQQNIVQLTDSESIKWDANGMAQKLLNRYLRPEEMDSIVSFIHTLETQDSTRRDELGATNPDGSPVVMNGSYEKLDSGAQIDNYIRLMMPIDQDNDGKVEASEAWTPQSYAAHLNEGSTGGPAAENRAIDQGAVDAVNQANAPSALEMGAAFIHKARTRGVD